MQKSFFEWATYLDKASNGEADAFMLGWTGDNGDADNFLYILLDKDSIGSNNYSRTIAMTSYTIF